VIRLVELKHVLGRRLVHRLLQARLIVPNAHDARGHPLFDAQSLHRTLGALARAVGLIEPRTYRPGNGAIRDGKKDELESIVIDAEELARLLE
jgi:hypothetical protein